MEPNKLKVGVGRYFQNDNYVPHHKSYHYYLDVLMKECLGTASKSITPDGVVLLHDAEREWFHAGFKNFVDGGKFVVSNPTPAARGGIQKLWEGRISKIKY